MGNLVIVQTVAPDYRENFFELLAKEYKGNFTLFAAEYKFSPEEMSKKTNQKFLRVKRHNFLNRKVILLTGMYLECLRAEKLVLELSPRMISTWTLLILRKLIGKPTILWGHAWPRKGKHSRSNKLRHVMRLMASQIICYTKQQAEELQEIMPNKKISYASNAIYKRSDMVALDAPVGNNIIYVGRLIQMKKPIMAVKAFAVAVSKLPPDSKLIIVGVGEERQNIENMVQELNLENRIELKGHVSDYSELQKLYSTSLISLSPGFVGLAVTQSFGFGVPMLISRDEPHAPEIECVRENKNAAFFVTDDAEDFGNKMLEMFKNKEYWASQRQNIIEVTRDKYSIENMIKPFVLL